MGQILDRYSRKIEYLRISVTDRCNLRCVYCMPECGLAPKEPAEILTFEEISSIVKLAVSQGIDKIRITGGEPLVRRDIVKLIESIFRISGIKDLSLTTNGVLLSKYAKELKSAGLSRINISLDTLNEDKFSSITREGSLSNVLEGIDKAKEAGWLVKLNVVVMRGINSDEILDFVSFCADKGVILRFIEFMPVGDRDFWNKDRFISTAEIKKIIGPSGSFEPADGVIGNGPAQYWYLKETNSLIGFISALSCKFCHRCNRLRLTADGFLLSCLAYDYGVNLKEALRKGKDEDEILKLIKEAIYIKPKEHFMSINDLTGYAISQVGG